MLAAMMAAAAMPTAHVRARPSPPGFDELTGLYRLDDERLMEVFDLVDQTRTPQLVTLDPASGRVRTLHALPSVSPDGLAFEARPGWFASETSDARLQFTVTADAVTGLVLEEEGPALRGRRIRFRERELTFRHGDVSLSGSLVLPDGPGPHPAIVIVHGSGPLTRRAPRDMAHLSAHRGIGAFAYDKRGANHGLLETRGDENGQPLPPERFAPEFHSLVLDWVARQVLPPLVSRAQQFRALLRDQRYEDARAMMADNPRRWFAPREGDGQPWRVGPGTGPWAAWDAHFRSEGELVAWRQGDRTATAVVRETNDYFRLLERGPVTNEMTYIFDGNDRISGLVIAAAGERPPGRTAEFLAWARRNDPKELEALMPGGEIDPSRDHPERFRALLNRWRVAAGLKTIESTARPDPSSALPESPQSPAPTKACSGPEARAFDFWIGEWDITQKILRQDGSWVELSARTSVTASLDGCALIEHWSGDVVFFWEGMKQPEPMKGLSVRAYDAEAGAWNIHWMDTRAPRFGSPYAGTFADGRGEFFREWETPQGPRVGRITFSEIRVDTVNWALAISSDARRTWQTIWTMAMRRSRR